MSRPLVPTRVPGLVSHLVTVTSSKGSGSKHVGGVTAPARPVGAARTTPAATRRPARTIVSARMAVAAPWSLPRPSPWARAHTCTRDSTSWGQAVDTTPRPAGSNSYQTSRIIGASPPKGKSPLPAIVAIHCPVRRGTGRQSRRSGRGKFRVVAVGGGGVGALEKHDVGVGGHDDVVPDGLADVVGDVVFHRGDKRLARRGIAVADDEIGLTGGEDENLVRLAVALNAGEGVGLDAVDVAEHGDAPSVEVEDGAIALGEEGADLDEAWREIGHRHVTPNVGVAGNCRRDACAIRRGAGMLTASWSAVNKGKGLG